jgi:CRISPR-associated exonuclease Cas4
MQMEDEQSLITGSSILSYQTCHRQAWLTIRRFAPEQENPWILIGRYIHQTSYRDRGEKEIQLPGAKIDLIWKDGTVRIVGEIKKSSRSFQGATMQLLFYLKLLHDRGIVCSGQILIPHEKRIVPIEWTEANQEMLGSTLDALRKLADLGTPPKPKWIGSCSKCGFSNLCWS